jgi:hypothetical protein
MRLSVLREVNRRRHIDDSFDKLGSIDLGMRLEDALEFGARQPVAGSERRRADRLYAPLPCELGLSAYQGGPDAHGAPPTFVSSIARLANEGQSPRNILAILRSVTGNA